MRWWQFAALALSCGESELESETRSEIGPSPPGAGTTTARASSLPAELVGRWRWHQAGDPSCRPDTGICTNRFARAETLQLDSDGRFEHVLFAESHFPSCSFTAHHESTGTATASGGSLTLRLASGATHVESSCSDDGITDERGHVDAYQWSVTDARLKLVDDQGTDLGPFDRE